MFRGLFSLFIMQANELQDVTAYGLRSDFLSPETMTKATVELALTKNRKLLLACMLAPGIYFFNLSKKTLFSNSFILCKYEINLLYSL